MSGNSYHKGGSGFNQGFERGAVVPVVSDDAESRELAQAWELVLESVDRDVVFRGVAEKRAAAMVAHALADVLDVKATMEQRTARALGVAYAIGFPGLPPMRKAPAAYHLERHGFAALSKFARGFVAHHGLAPSQYMKSEKAVDSARRCNRRRRKENQDG